MTRILFLITDLEIGGTERALARLVAGLDRRRFEPVVVALKGEGPIGREVAAAGIRLVNLKMAGPWDLIAVLRLYALIRRLRPRVLHAFLFHANLLGRILGRLAGVPRIITSIRTMEGKRHHAPMERLTWRLGDAVTFASEAVRDFARRRMGMVGGRVIYNGVPEPGPAVDVSAEVVTASRLAPGKGIDDFIRAARIVAGSYPDVRFVVIGSGPDEASLKAQGFDKLRFTGWIRNVPEALKSCSIFVHASRLGEGLPNAVLEAMAAGRPVVATDVGGTREAVVDGQTGFLVPPGDPAAIADRVGKLLSDPALARSMGERGLARAREGFSVDAMMARHHVLYSRHVGEAAI